MGSDQIPETLAEVVDAIGWDPAAQLARTLGGTCVYVPERMTPEHVLVRVLGHKAAYTLAETFGGEQITVPRCARALRNARNRQLRSRRDAGHSISSLALRYDMTMRQVYNVLAETEPEDDGQGSLF